MSYIGLDIGGTKIFGARYTDNFKLQKDVRVLTHAARGKTFVLRQIEDVIEHLLDKNVKAIGIAWAGFVDFKQGKVVGAANIPGWKNVTLKTYLEKKYNIEVWIDNDARLMTLGEQQLGCAKKKESVIGLTLGTGLGAGIIINGEIFRGSQGYANELGHTLKNLNNTESEIEKFLGARKIEKYFKKHIGTDDLFKVEELCIAKHKKMYTLIDPFLTVLANFIYNQILTFNPEMFVLGGGIGAHIIPYFDKELCKIITTTLEQKGFPHTFKISYSKLKNAGSVGAALLAKNHSEKK